MPKGIAIPSQEDRQCQMSKMIAQWESMNKIVR